MCGADPLPKVSRLKTHLAFVRMFVAKPHYRRALAIYAIKRPFFVLRQKLGWA